MTTMTRRSACAVATSAFGMLVSGLVSAPKLAGAAQGSRLKFELYRSGSEFRWRLKAANGNVLASGEGYKAKADCRHAIELIKRGAGAAAITDLTS